MLMKTIDIYILDNQSIIRTSVLKRFTGKGFAYSYEHGIVLVEHLVGTSTAPSFRLEDRFQECAH